MEHLGAVPALIAALEDDAANVRRSVAQALGQLKAGAAGPALRRMIEQESDPRARQAAEKALVALLE